MAAPVRARVFAAVLFLAAGMVIAPLLASAQIGASNTRTLLWTAPGDDGNVGRASHYEIHYSSSPISDSADSVTFAAWWSGSSTILDNAFVPAPSSAGRTDSTHVTNLSYGSTYYFVLRTQDDAQNWSYFSNVAVSVLPACSAPTTTPTLTAAPDSAGISLGWTGNDPLATHIQIYRGASPALLTLMTTLPSSDTQYEDTSVSGGVTYYYALAWSADCGNGPIGSATAVTKPRPMGAPPAPHGTASIAAYPNPSQGAIRFVVNIQGSASEQGTVWLYDLAGHRVALLAEGSFPAGSSSFTWERLSSTGHAVAPGYYEAIGTIGGSKVRERLILLP